MINTLSKMNLSKIVWEGGGSTTIWIMSLNILGFFRVPLRECASIIHQHINCLYGGEGSRGKMLKGELPKFFKNISVRFYSNSKNSDSFEKLIVLAVEKFPRSFSLSKIRPRYGQNEIKHVFEKIC